MAAETNIIREFLVALGFKTDESALKNFSSGIDKATKAVVGLAAAVETTAIAVAAGVARFASNLEALYFASIRTHTAAANLKAFDLAAQNFGANAGDATSSIEGLARQLRTNPGTEGLLAAWGAQARDAKGNLRDLSNVMLDLREHFAREPLFVAEQQAAMLGINEKTLLAMLNGDFAREVERQRAQMKNTGFKEATEDAHRFMVQLRDLQVYVEAFGVRVMDALQNKLGMSLEQIKDWLATNGPMLADRVATIMVKLIDLAERVGKGIVYVIDKLIEWDKATDGWSTKLLGALLVLKMFGGFEIIAGVLKLAGAFLTLGGNIAAATVSGTGLIGLLGRMGLGTAAFAGGYGLGTLLNKFLPQSFKDKLGELEAMVLASFDNKTAREALAANNPAQFLKGFGWTDKEIPAILANLRAESGMNPNAVGDHGQAYGIAQWHPDRQAKFKEVMGMDIRDSGVAEQLEFMTYELRSGAFANVGKLMLAADNTRRIAEIMSRQYEIPAAADAEAKKRGDMAVRLAQETNIHVHGVSDPNAAAQSVVRAQGRVNADLTRNLQVAAQ